MCFSIKTYMNRRFPIRNIKSAAHRATKYLWNIVLCFSSLGLQRMNRAEIFPRNKENISITYIFTYYTKNFCCISNNTVKQDINGNIVQRRRPAHELPHFNCENNLVAGRLGLGGQVTTRLVTARQVTAWQVTARQVTAMQVTAMQVTVMQVTERLVTARLVTAKQVTEMQVTANWWQQGRDNTNTNTNSVEP